MPEKGGFFAEVGFLRGVRNLRGVRGVEFDYPPSFSYCLLITTV
jgi:hypothetical protein